MFYFANFTLFTEPLGKSTMSEWLFSAKENKKNNKSALSKQMKDFLALSLGYYYFKNIKVC